MVTIVIFGASDDRRLRALVNERRDARLVFASDASPADWESAEAALLWWVGSDDVDRLIARAPRLRWIHSISTGLDRILTPALVACPAVLTHTRGVYGAALAEFALGAMLFFAKDFARMRASQTERRWDPFEVEMLRSQTLGILGFGDIGQKTAVLARAFGMRVVVSRRRAHESPNDGAVTFVTKEKLLSESDYLVLAAPLTNETRQMIGARELGQMKQSAVVINVGRGSLVDEPALAVALAEGRIRGAALDVFEEEPLAPSSRLFSMANVLLSPHCADRTATWLDDALECFRANVPLFVRGETLLYQADKERGY